MNTAVLFSSASDRWATPAHVYAALDAEFRFTLDPCPLTPLGAVPAVDGRTRSWAYERVFCNPPYNRGVGDWLKKAREADVAVFLVAARTCTRWWHDYAMQADEIRFLRGRLKFPPAIYNAPFPSVVLVYRRKTNWDSSANGDWVTTLTDHPLTTVTVHPPPAQVPNT